MKNILVTGSGGIGGVNFIRALRATKENFFIVGTDFNQYYLEFQLFLFLQILKDPPKPSHQCHSFLINYR